jgi:AraC family transcriptional regulator
MAIPTPRTIDFKHKGASAQLFRRPSVLNSHQADWNGIYVEYNCQAEVDTGEHCLANHTMTLKLDSPIQGERWLDGRFHNEERWSGTSSLLPAGVQHRYVTKRAGEFLLLALEPQFLNTIAQDWIDSARIQLIPCFGTQEDPLIFGIGQALKTELASGCLGGRLYADSLTTTLAVHLLHKYSTFAPATPTCSNGLPPRKLQRAIAYIREHLDTNLSIADIAAQLGMSSYYFQRLFKRSMGITPYQYVIQQRIEQAKGLLKHKELAIADIAFRCGFKNQGHLTDTFRKCLRTTPKAYRDSL